MKSKKRGKYTIQGEQRHVDGYVNERDFSPEAKDCFDGFESDRDPRYAHDWTVAEFSPTYNGEMLYLKMSICMNTNRAKCLSVKAYVERKNSDG